VAVVGHPRPVHAQRLLAAHRRPRVAQALWRYTYK
jgi:hypothetical protein